MVLGYEIFTQEAIIRFLYWAYYSSYIWLTLLTGFLFYLVWMKYIRLKWIYSQKPVLLEVRLPKDIKKSPYAMEVFFTSLFQDDKPTVNDAFLAGKVRPWFSFELASFGGDVHFFIWTFGRYKNLVEAQIYAQYPTVEILEVPDYTLPVHYDIKTTTAVGFCMVLSKSDVYPIQTYVDLKLDEKYTNEPEEFTDPISSVLEYLGSLRPGEQAWIQIIARAHRKQKFLIDATFANKDIAKDIDAEIKKIKEEKSKPDKDGQPPKPLNSLDIKTIESLERSKAKYPFDVAIRSLYIASNDKVNPANISGLKGAFRQYSNLNLNSFKIGFGTGLDYPWQDFRKIRTNKYRKTFIDAYKKRSFFEEPHKHWKVEPFVLNTEELATIYHFPGGVVTTPTVVRVGSKRGEAPKNLPV